MTKGSMIVHVRMPDQVIDGIDQAAQGSQVGRSAYCRQLITAAVESGLGLGELCERISNGHTPDPDGTPVSPVAMLGPRRVLTGRCLHPIHMVRQYPSRDVCGSCETVLRQR